MEEIFKNFVYTFIKRNSDKIQYAYEELGFKNKNELLKSVKENLELICGIHGFSKEKRRWRSPRK